MLLKTKLNSQGVFQITLNRPQKHHALNCELLEQLNASLAEAYTNPEIKAILIASQGKVFCAGADLNDMREKNIKEYTDLDFIRKEVDDSKILFKKNNWPIIDVTRRSVEETAASILKIIEIKKSNK